MFLKFIKTGCVSLLFAFVTTTLSAHEYKLGDLKIDHPWAKPTAPGVKVAGGYLKIENKGKEADRLVSVTLEASETSEIHEMAMDNGVMTMKQLKNGLEIKSGETVELKPGSLHLMFINLKTPLKEGDKVKGTLTFEKAGAVDVTFNIEMGQKKKEGEKAETHDHSGHDHSHDKEHGTKKQH